MVTLGTYLRHLRSVRTEVVRAHVTLPLGFGGQGITDICEIADNALAANWHYTSSYLASRVPALARIAAPSEDGNGPMNDMIEPVWDRVRARGAEGDKRRERDILPEFADSAAAPCTAKGLQHLLSQMCYARKFEQMKASAVSLSEDHSADPHAREFAAQVAVTMNSHRGEGALLICEFKTQAFMLRSPFSRYIIVRTKECC
eukprot:31479-Pelagococcus_subviridis.AAC.43